MVTRRFLTNDGLVLAYVSDHLESTGLEIANAVGITERSARQILANLQAAGYIQWEKVGRRNRYCVNAAQPIRLVGEREVTVGELLDALPRTGDSAGIPEVRRTGGWQNPP